MGDEGGGEAGAVEELAQLPFLGGAFAGGGKPGVDHARHGRVGRREALRRRLDDLDEARAHEMPLLLDDLGLDLLAGPGAGHEHDAPVAEAAEAVPAVDVLRDADGRDHFVNFTAKPPPFAMRSATFSPALTDLTSRT